MTSVSRAAPDPAPVDESGGGDLQDGVPPDTNQAPALFDDYLEPDRPHAGAYDEMFHADGTVRPHYRALHEAIAPTAAADLKVRSEALDRAYVDQGITFSLSGQERPFPLDIVPRVISAAEWGKLQRGIVQRVRALEMFLADIYGDAEIVRDGVLPRRLSPAASTSTGPRPGSSRPTASASTSPGSTSCATRRACSGCSRTTSATRRACRT